MADSRRETKFTDLTPDVVHRIALHAGDEKGARSLMELLPPYREYVTKTPSVRMELYDAVAENNVFKSYRDGVDLTEYRAFGKLHRRYDRPAQIEQLDNTKRESFYRDGELRRDGNPTRIRTDPRGNGESLITEVTYGETNELESFNGAPSTRKYLASRGRDNPLTMMYHHKGRLHRDNDLPAIIRDDRNDSGSNQEQRYAWFVNGASRRQDPSMPVIVRSRPRNDGYSANWLQDDGREANSLPISGAAYDFYMHPVPTASSGKRKRDD